MGTLRIRTLGTDFSITAKEDDHYLTMLLENYKNMVKLIEKANDQFSSADALKTSILAGIMLCDELYKEKQKSAKFKTSDGQQVPELREVERITLEMIDKIDRALT
jgi:cell division protein ZapA